jgi:hypothetical protein
MGLGGIGEIRTDPGKGRHGLIEEITDRVFPRVRHRRTTSQTATTVIRSSRPAKSPALRV